MKHTVCEQLCDPVCSTGVMYCTCQWGPDAGACQHASNRLGFCRVPYMCMYRNRGSCPYRSLRFVSTCAHVDRELALFKIGVPHGTARSEVLELTSIFSGKVVDVGSEALTVALSGDPGKLFAFESSVRPFGLMQLSRTGRITLLKSDEGLDLPALGPIAPSRTVERDYERAQQGVEFRTPCSTWLCCTQSRLRALLCRKDTRCRRYS